MQPPRRHRALPVGSHSPWLWFFDRLIGCVLARIILSVLGRDPIRGRGLVVPDDCDDLVAGRVRAFVFGIKVPFPPPRDEVRATTEDGHAGKAARHFPQPIQWQVSVALADAAHGASATVVGGDLLSVVIPDFCHFALYPSLAERTVDKHGFRSQAFSWSDWAGVANRFHVCCRGSIRVKEWLELLRVSS
jgi:hypothetical protein